MFVIPCAFVSAAAATYFKATCYPEMFLNLLLGVSPRLPTTLTYYLIINPNPRIFNQTLVFFYLVGLVWVQRRLSLRRSSSWSSTGEFRSSSSWSWCRPWTWSWRRAGTKCWKLNVLYLISLKIVCNWNAL